ncbi:MAG: SDR family oxidoreductase [Acidobacteria bacterium]|nr:SDR family oxidoreductase [Acidobacteriota bacterium]
MGLVLSLSNKVALVTGGSRGIGRATVRMFSLAGAKVVFNYQKQEEAAAQLVNECGEDSCTAVECDLTGTATAQSLVDRTVARHGRLDILVANHGIWPAEDVEIRNMSDEQWRRTMAVNLDSVFALVRHTAARMKQQATNGATRGHIVLISSTSGQRGEAFHADYSATKGALISLTKSLSSELIRDGIYVNCVAPGWVDTDMSRPALNQAGTREAILATIPLGRVGKPEEIAGPILFLCTPLAGFISGEVLNVNGGAVLAG